MPSSPSGRTGTRQVFFPSNICDSLPGRNSRNKNGALILSAPLVQQKSGSFLLRGRLVQDFLIGIGVLGIGPVMRFGAVPDTAWIQGLWFLQRLSIEEIGRGWMKIRVLKNRRRDKNQQVL